MHYTNAYSIAIVISPDLGAFWNSAIRPSVPRRSCLGYRHAGCLQLSHCRPLEMCGLLTRPQTDVYSPRFLPPSNCHRRAGGISSRRPRGDTMSLLLCPEFAKFSVRRAADWYFSHSMRSRVYVAVGCPSIHLPVCLSVCPSVLSFSRRTPGLLLRDPASRIYWSIAARPAPSSNCEQCHVVSWRRKLNTDLSTQAISVQHFSLRGRQTVPEDIWNHKHCTENSVVVSR